ncbi:hypothetical protein Rsub_09419 [Raphidocelis subcapitata]|uniref:Uncharacterized protein n=1 Tax=Raphidocelis subcapitata TaxID=307507 RepID=A0A2V0P914_9CHLO|nr:hypothetical protein Rsub_09419 [Raphidocelis subcapitata]|eukprot:GBF96348.1 hypothetical protein Rsub_09419 [Raphidocelis subcapitata]
MLLDIAAAGAGAGAAPEPRVWELDATGARLTRMSIEDLPPDVRDTLRATGGDLIWACGRDGQRAVRDAPPGGAAAGSASGSAAEAPLSAHAPSAASAPAASTAQP